MGVDIATYRSRVGTFKHAFGQDVVTHTVEVDIPTFRRIVIWEILCVLVLIIALLETSLVIKYPHEFDNTRHLTLNHWDVVNSVMSLTFHSIAEVVGYCMLFTTVLPQLHSNPNRKYKDNGSTMDVLRVSTIAKSSSVFYVIGAVSFVGMLLLMAGIESNPGPGEGKTTGQSQQKETDVCPLLERLDLVKYFPGKIKLFDVISIAQKDIVSLEGRPDEKLPWILLRNLMFVNEDAFCLDDPTENKVPDSDSSSVDEDSSDEDSRNEKSTNVKYSSDEMRYLDTKINYLDVFLLVYQCCCPMLQQVLCQKMFLCRFAFPFLFTPLDHDIPVVSKWPLRSLVVETNSKENAVSEYDVLELPTKTFAFCRIGRPDISKSQLLNILVSDDRSKTFFNYDSHSGNVSKSLSIKYIESIWLPKSGTDKDKFDDTIMVLNMRGCIRQFDKPTLTFMSSFVDVISVAIQQDDILKYKSELEKLASLFKEMLFIIVGSYKGKHLKPVLEDLKTDFRTNLGCKVSFVKTYDVKSKKMKSDGNVTREIVDGIKKHTQKQDIKSFETRLRECTREQIRTDEEVESCKYGHSKAIEFVKIVNLDTDFLSLMTKVTPIQSTIAINLGTLFKELKREKDTNIQEKRREKMQTVRKEIETKITEPIRHMLNVLCDNISVEQLEYFLAWLEFYITRRGRHHLSELKQEHKQAWAIFQKQKHEETENIDDAKKSIVSVKSRVDAASFSVEHLFREIGLIYDTVSELRLSENDLNIPSVETIASVIGKLMLNGRHFELIDSDSFYLQAKWMSKIFESLHKQIQCRKVMTISVLGIQSSGKSTLLNTMFGALFSTGSGRCTRGIHAQLIPLHEELISKGKLDYEYALILDSEGLRSTEIIHASHEHDNELATLITGLGNTTIVNVMGENTQEIRDILQIVAHAFLRIKLVNERIALHNRCILVQQNITSMAATDKLSDGLNKFVSNLDEMTQDSAMCEGVDNIRTFSDVIDFDVSSDVCYLPNVWHGNPPLARVNKTYSDDANNTKQRIFKQSPDSTFPTFKTLSQFICQTNDLWQGVLSENFVFSFKNSLERRAYLEMDEIIQTILWKIELSLTKTMHSTVQKKFSNCHSLDEADTAENVTHSLLDSLINKELEAAKAEVAEYFETSKNRTIIVQWNESQRGRIQRFFDKIQGFFKGNIRNETYKIKTKLRFNENKRKSLEVLHQQTLEYSETHDVKCMTDQEKKNLFEKLWTKLFGIDDPNKQTDVCTLDKCFGEWLFDIHPTRQTWLISMTEEMKLDDHTKMNSPTILNFEKTGIETKDILSGCMSKDKLSCVKKCVQTLFSSLIEEVDALCAKEDHISDTSVRSFLHGFKEEQVSVLSNENIKVKELFYMKIHIHVCMYAKQFFKEHNMIYRQTLCTQFNNYKQELERLFNGCIESRQLEDSVAEHVARAISKHIATEAKTQMYVEIQNILHGILPSTKNRLIIEICSGMVDANEFGKIMSYIKSPFATALEWIEQKALHVLFEEDKFTVYILRIVDNLFSKVMKSLRHLQENDGEMITTKEVLTRLLSDLSKDELYIPISDFDSVLSWHLSSVNVKIVCSKINAKLVDDSASVKTSFQSYTKSTVWWEGRSPFHVIFQRIWGCTELCPYCNEPCEKSTNSHTEDHTCVQHRPQCCNGIRYTNTKQACPETCNYEVQSHGSRHTCSVFKYKCNDGISACELRWHAFRQYREILNTWHIFPSSDMHDSSKFWLWFVGKFKTELKERYDYETDDIPDAWSTISPEDAKESLRSVYG